jgi:hypothetical protein
MVMDRCVIGAALLAASSLASAGQAAAPGTGRSEKPLDLTVPRQAGQWTDLAVRNVPLEPAPVASSPARPADAAARTRNQPYGTGYEARMSPMAASGGPGHGAGSPPAPAPRGRGR